MAATYSALGWQLRCGAFPPGQDILHGRYTGKHGGGPWEPPSCDHYLYWRKPVGTDPATGDPIEQSFSACVSDEMVTNAATILGRKGGLKTSPAKAAAARENGTHGGRPPGS